MNVDLNAVNGVLTLVNTLVSIHILVMVVIVVGRSHRMTPAHVGAAKVSFVLFALLGFWTVFSRYLLAMDGPATELAVSFIATSMRFGLAIITTAWAWDLLDDGKETE